MTKFRMQSWRLSAALLAGLCASAALAQPVGGAGKAVPGPAGSTVSAPAPLVRSVVDLSPTRALGARIAAGGAILGQDLVRLRADPLALLSPLVPLSRIRVIDLDRPLPALGLGDVLSPGGWAGRYVLGQVRGGTVIELSGWWGSALLPLGQAGRGGAGRAGGDPRLAGLFADLAGATGTARTAGWLIGSGPGGQVRPLLPLDGGPGRLPPLPAPGPVASGSAAPDVPTPVPLPGALVFLGAAIVALALVRRRRRPDGPAA